MISVLYTEIAARLLAMHAFVVPTFDERDVAKNYAPPRMIMFPTKDAFGPVEGPGGNPRPLLTVLEWSQLVIHAMTRDVVQGLRDQFLIALHEATKGSSPSTSRAGRYLLSDGTWTRATMHAAKGYEYKLAFASAVPIVKRTWASSTQAPTPATYVGPQANTYPVEPAGTLEADTTVGVESGSSVVTIKV